ncbi:MAG: 2,4-dichlorophenoxyacetate dioxygenase [Planctomycetaceae bacterium]|nr:2,4-dichlorophenoxyacetate dioxygenase [Planctomycetaceae bacterium]MBP61866.1 2,4-dichlorophenoxyacetate dioxygenase [Planctomycetaceae bacterium]
MGIKINRLEGCIGAEVEGVDITGPIDAQTYLQLQDALDEHIVLVFHDQDITDAQQVIFSERFGPLEMSLPSDPFGGGGPVFNIANVDADGQIRPAEDPLTLYQSGNLLWHSDGSFREVPLQTSFLSAKVIPPEGGETEFSSLRAAYAALPSEKKVLLEGLVAEHSMAHSRARIAPNLLSKSFQDEVPPVRHLLVRTISATGEKVHFVGSYASHVIGWPFEKGRDLLQELLQWSTQPQFVYRHQWRVNDLVMWDNRLSLHRGRPWDVGKYKRIMHRTTLAGEGSTVPQD